MAPSKGPPFDLTKNWTTHGGVGPDQKLDHAWGGAVAAGYWEPTLFSTRLRKILDFRD